MKSSDKSISDLSGENKAPSKLTKKVIRETLAPLSRALLAGERPKRIKFMGYEIGCRQLYNQPGQIGPVWKPDFVVYANDPDKQRLVMGGSLTETVDALHCTQGLPRNGFFFVKAA
jgi:hypothetical protein